MANTTPDSRTRLLAAAAQEFASLGFAGANVDRLARRAGVNKAMIYYHFKSKAALYREILREMFAETLARVRAIADSPAPAAERLDAFVEAIVETAQARPHFPAIWLRELAEGGRHLDPEIIRLLAGIPAALARILRDSREKDVFHDAHPLLAHFSITGPLMLYFGSIDLRKRFAGTSGLLGADLDASAVIRHVQRTVRATLTDGPDAPGSAGQRVRPRKLRATSRPVTPRRGIRRRQGDAT